MALSPVLHQLHRTGRRRRYHPPPPRDHRDRVRRPDRRAAGSYAVGALWRQLGLGPVCRDRPQPATRRRHPRRFSARRRARGHPAAQDRQHPRPPDPPATQTHPASAQPLALGRRMACAVAQHNRLPPPTTRLTIPPNTARLGTNKGKAGQTSRLNTPAHRTIKINAQPIQPRPPSVDPGLENARFCHGCGSPVKDGDARAEYKQVTVLFANVVHSMDIGATVGAERLREIMTALVERSVAVVERYGGTVDKFTGDGIMAVFGAPTALEDHAFRACLAAVGLQEETKRLAVDVHARDGVDLQLRVGLNSGQVIAGEIGSSALGYTAIGDQVGMAQRMESVAPPGGVMLSASTARFVDGAATLGES